MTKSEHSRRATSRTARVPATRFGHLQKRIRKDLSRATPPIKK